MTGVWINQLSPILFNLVWITYFLYVFVLKNFKILNSKKIHSTANLINDNKNLSVNRIKFFLTLNIVSIYSNKITQKDYSELLWTYSNAAIILNVSMFFILILKHYIRDLIMQINIVFPVFTTLLYLLYLSKNYLNLLISLELITVGYYFLFLEATKKSKINVIRYKNLVNNYLWTSFFTLVLYCIGLVYLLFTTGLADFSEINFYRGSKDLKVAMVLFFISFSWKLGLSGFHFYKIELYRYFTATNLFIFIIFSFILNTYVMYFLCYWLSAWGFILNIPLLVLILFFNVLILLYKSEKVTLGYFLAVSSINTWIFLVLVIFI